MFTNSISSLIYNTALADGMPEILARLIVGQAKHESGNYKSKFAVKYKSLFGYMKSNSKWQIETSGSKADNNAEIAEYATFEDSVHEMTSWIKRRVKDGRFPKDLSTITTPLQYATLLQNCGYFQGWKKYTKEQNLAFYAKGIEKGLVD